MNPDDLFRIANLLALAGWAVLAAAPFAPKLAEAISGAAIPLLLSTLYAGLVLAFWSGAEGGFGTLADVQALFRTPEIALAGWVHYLAFDLFVGAWIARTALRERLSWALVLPCLALAFLFGPCGLLAFRSIRAARGPVPELAK